MNLLQIFKHSNEYVELQTRIHEVDPESVPLTVGLTVNSFLGSFGQLLATAFKAGTELLQNPVFDVPPFSFFTVAVSLQSDGDCKPNHILLQFRYDSDLKTLTLLEPDHDFNR